MRKLTLLLAIALVSCGPSNNGNHGGDAGNPIDATGTGVPDARPAPDAIGPDLGNPCTTSADCPGGYCVTGPAGDVCSYACAGSCPTNWSCRVTEVDGTLTSLCLPLVFPVCDTCADDSQCNGAACVVLDGQGVCLANCFEGCANGYTCGPDPTGQHAGSFCVPDSGSCTCSATNLGQERTCSNANGIGTCFGTETCTATGWSGCNAATASPEVCDGIDNDCNFLIDDGLSGQSCSNTVPGVGTCPGVSLCTGANGEICQGKTPQPETCNHADDDCDLTIDEGFPGLGDSCSAGVGACVRGGVQVCTADGTGIQCSATAGQPVPELCNGVDDDCDNSTDEDFPSLGNQCTVSTGVCQRIGTTICTSDGSGTKCSATPGTAGTEVCNLVDDDCDGSIDEDFRNPVTGAYDHDNACGSCAVDCTTIYSLPNASGHCNATGSPTCQMVCDPGDFDLNGQTADGCEFVLDPGAIYVSIADPASADDATCGNGPVGTGAGNHPCHTITFGISRASSTNRPRVLVANGIYSESVTVANGRNLLGGYLPDTWARNVQATGTVINGVSSIGSHDITVNATSITSATLVEGFVIYGSVNNKSGGNSYAVYVNGSNASLSIKNNIIFGGRGGPGGNGGIGSDGTNGVGGTGRNPNLGVADPTYDAKDATGSGECNTSNNRNGGAGGSLTCGGVNVSGGAGGGNRCPALSNCDTDSSSNGYGCLQAASNFHWNENMAFDGASGNAGGGANGGTAGTGAYGGDDMIQIFAPNPAYDSYVCYIPCKTGDAGCADTDPDPDNTYGLDGAAGGDGQPGTAVTGCSAASGAVVGGHWVGGPATGGNSGGNGAGGGGGGAGGGGKCEADNFGTLCADGAGKDTLGGAAGGGGSGGCGGVGGGAAAAGGGTFDIFVVAPPGTTQPVITGNTLLRGQGGTGGTGGAGGTGGTGGQGAPGGTTGVPVIFCTDTAGRGGNGGDGGDGSGGGGGCGGSTFGIYTSGIGSGGTAPNYCLAAANNTISGGSGGAGGAGGYSIVNTGGPGTAGTLATCSFN